jgi:hypothetical protein
MNNINSNYKPDNSDFNPIRQTTQNISIKKSREETSQSTKIFSQNVSTLKPPSSSLHKKNVKSRSPLFSETVTYPKDDFDRENLASKIQVGDIIFTKVTRGKGANVVDKGISFLQRILSIFKRGRSKKGSSIIHASIVTGIDTDRLGRSRILISEAMPSKKGKSGLRTVDLFRQSNATLGSGKAYEYQIFRANKNTQNTVTTAAKIAKRIAPKVPYLTGPRRAKTEHKTKFSFKIALKSIFRKKKSLGKSGTRRVFKQIFDETLQHLNPSGKKKKSRKFFCSYFTSHVLQQAEASERWTEIMNKSTEISKEYTNYTNQIKNAKTPKEGKKIIDIMAKKFEKKYGDLIRNKMKTFNFDAKKMSPQDFYQFVTDTEKGFEPTGRFHENFLI